MAGTIQSTQNGHPARSSKRRGRITAPPEGFEPLALMPTRDLPLTQRRRWQRLADRAHTQPMAAVELHCIDCNAWERVEAARCEIQQCALWAINERIFRARAQQKQSESQ